MKQEFITYEQALELKELGFNEPCLGYYVTVEVPNPFLVTTKISDTQGGYFTFAPLYQQAFRFFRDKHILQHEIVYDMSDDLTNKVYVYTVFGTDRSEEYKTYEEAEQACLDKLIEIVKNKQD